MAGLTSEGFEVKTLDEIKTSLEERVKATFGDEANVSPRSVFGQLIGVFAPELADVWELAQELYNSMDPDQAEDALLHNLGTFVGVRPIAPNPSTTSSVILTGENNTVVEEGSVIEVEETGSRYQTTEEALIVTTTLATGSVEFFDNDPALDTMERSIGSFLVDGVRPGTLVTIEDTTSNNQEDAEVDSVTADTITFASGVTLTAEGPLAATIKVARAIDVPVASVDNGPVDGFAYTLDTIVNPVDGWLTVINTEDVLLGDDVETNSEFRRRRESSFQVRGAGVDNAIQSNLLQIEGVEHARVYSNRSDETDADGRPAHSMEAVIWPDTGDPDYAQSLAELIWALWPGGIEAYGTSNFLVTDSEDYEQPMGFSFATEIDLYIKATITKGADYPANGDALVAALLLAEGNELSVADDVLVWKFYPPIDSIPGVIDITIAIDIASSPTNEANIAIGARQIARFDSTRIEIA